MAQHTQAIAQELFTRWLDLYDIRLDTLHLDEAHDGLISAITQALDAPLHLIAPAPDAPRAIEDLVDGWFGYNRPRN